MARNKSAETATPEAGQVVSDSEAAGLEQRMSAVAFAEIQELDAIADLFKETVPQLARDIRAASNSKNLSELMLTDPHLPDDQKALYTGMASDSARVAESGEVNMRVASRMLEQELQDVLALIPEDQKAQYVAGFLRHHDLIRTENGDSSVTYTQNLDQEQARSGLYVPTVLINNETQR